MSHEGRIRFSVELKGSDPQTYLGRTIEAEKWGYDVVWVPDHLTDRPPAESVLDAWTMLGYLGSQTKRIGLAAGVTDTQRVHPAKTASIVSTLDRITNGRAILGIGAGEVMNTKPYGIAWESVDARVSRVKEAIILIRLLWASSFEKPANFQGEYYRLEGANLGLLPSQEPAPPIYIGAWYSSKMLDIVATLGDGWYASSVFTADSYGERVAVIKAGAQRAGRKLESIDRIAFMPIVMAPMSPSLMDRLKKVVRKEIVEVRYLSRILGIEYVLDSIPKDLQYQLVIPSPQHSALVDRIAEELPIPDDVLEKAVEELINVGTPDKCISRIDEFVKAGATHVLVSSPIDEPSVYGEVATKIIPYYHQGEAK